MLINLLLLSIVSLVCIVFVRRERKRNIAISCSYRFYALRDKLRMIEIKNSIRYAKHRNVIETFDLSLSKIISQLDNLSLYKAIYLSNKHKEDIEYKKSVSALSLILKKEPELSDIYDEYGEILMRFFMENHSTSVSLIIRLIRSFSFLRKFTEYVKAKILNIRTLPETSIFCPAR